MGTYVTQSAFTSGSNQSQKTGPDEIKRPPLRQFFMDGDFSLAGCLSTSLTKQGFRFLGACDNQQQRNVNILKYLHPSSIYLLLVVCG